MEKAILIILDGWGIRNQKKGNAIKLAKTPNFERLKKEYSYTTLEASGKAVGLIPGMMGNSETGHLNIGAGRIVPQEITRINKAIKDKSFFKNKNLLKAVSNVKKHNSTLHLIGLASIAGVHSYLPHLFALIKTAKQHGIKKVLIHPITDGRDSPIKSAEKFIKEIQKNIKKYKTGKISTLIGRYYAMDRDNRWDRTKKAYEALVNAKGVKINDAVKGIKSAYKKNQTDEFIKPMIIDDFKGIDKKDSVIFFNYRTDRARQLTKLLSKKATFVCMTEYYNGAPNPIFKNIIMKKIFGEVISKKGLKQLRIAETEKYAHVTYFFNSEIEKPFKNEKRILIPSPKVATYDLKPEMSAYRITNKLLKNINKFDVVILNFANCDMVGHSGKLKPAIKAIEVVDKCLGKIINHIKDWNALIIADHGNAEDMTGKKASTHTTNLVPCILVCDKKYELKKGKLADVAPTLLKILNIKKPKEMTGKCLI